MSNEELIERLRDEADLCRNEGASDIAALLDEVAAAFAQPAQAVPPGWKLVPVEPTDEMLGRGIEAQITALALAGSDSRVVAGGWQMTRACYAAMLDAAPEVKHG